MWPVLLDMTKEESMQCLRNLELEAYAHLVSALRAQGPLNPDKRKLLKDSGQVLNITQDRHKAEIRRAVNDEKLNTIAFHVTGVSDSLEDWVQEGRRSVPLMPRMAPQTAYSAIADEMADCTTLTNKQLPPPAATERKRPPSQPVQVLIQDSGKGLPFRVPENPKSEEIKKRKFPICTENSSLAQHLLGPSKISRTQQIYRQRTKAMMKEQAAKNKSLATKLPFNTHYQTNNGPKLNLSHMSAPVSSSSPEETIEQIQNEINSYIPQKSTIINDSSGDSEVKKIISQKIGGLGPNVTFKHIPSTSGVSNFSNLTLDQQKSLKICPPGTAKKSLVNNKPTNQKLIVVSNAQTIQSSSILQKTLSIPLSKNLSLKNFEKFKIVTTSSQSNNLNSIKHKVVTVKTNTNTTKKVIPLSILNSKGGIKVLPIGGKIVGKTMSSAPSSPLYIVNTTGGKNTVTTVVHSHSSQGLSSSRASVSCSPAKENGKSSVLGDILKASGVTTEDFDSQIEEFRIPNNSGEGEQPITDETDDDCVILQEDTGLVEPVLTNETIEIDDIEHMAIPTAESEMTIQDSDVVSVSESDTN